MLHSVQPAGAWVAGGALVHPMVAELLSVLDPKGHAIEAEQCVLPAHTLCVQHTLHKHNSSQPGTSAGQPIAAGGSAALNGLRCVFAADAAGQDQAVPRPLQSTVPAIETEQPLCTTECSTGGSAGCCGGRMHSIRNHVVLCS